MTVIACIGLGHMGLGVATRLLSAGHEVSVYDPAAGSADALSTMGAMHASSPRDACAGAEAILVMVRDDDVSRAVWLGDDGVLAGEFEEGALALECSTLSHGWVTTWAEALRQRGLRPIDCPVTGVPDATAAGTLVLNVGAEAGDLERARPLLDELAEDILHLGPPGSGTAYKLVANLLASVQLAGAAEAMAVAAGAGLDLDRVTQALTKDRMANRLISDNLRRMVDDHHDHDLTFPVSLRQKDTAYGVALAKDVGIEAPFASAALVALEKLQERGWDDLNESKIFDLFRRQST
ncbi:MAG: NAD(P)-dependent oxidoreductase [Pseudomonadota bacterium]